MFPDDCGTINVFRIAMYQRRLLLAAPVLCYVRKNLLVRVFTASLPAMACFASAVPLGLRGATGSLASVRNSKRYCAVMQP